MMTKDRDLAVPSDQPETVAFVPTRRAGLARLDDFVSRTGAHYAARRNYDLGPQRRSTVSALSPWIRHRLITEEEVLSRTLAHHSAADAMAFIQEVFWRGYFKGWLQQHPSVWHSYQRGLAAARYDLDKNAQRNVDYQCAILGRTGIGCFDHWCRELKETGYLHNHARMWFASIWIFTLRLPWELGADFFLTHLIDGDPASNTLSWRWVGGLHTKGKTYLAQASNIAKFTDGAFNPVGQLAETADPLVEDDVHDLVSLPPVTRSAEGDFILLITPEDCWPDPVICNAATTVLALVDPDDHGHARPASRFVKGAVADAAARLAKPENFVATDDWSTTIVEAAEQAGTRQVVTAFAPIGPVATKLAGLHDSLAAEGIRLHQSHRPYDVVTWPHATKGFFKLKKKIPQILSDLGLQDG